MITSRFRCHFYRCVNSHTQQRSDLFLPNLILHYSVLLLVCVHPNHGKFNKRRGAYSSIYGMHLTSPPLVGMHRHGHVNSVNVEMKCHLKCKLSFSSAQFMLRRMHWTNLSVSIEAEYWVSWLSRRTRRRPLKTALEFIILCSRSGESRWPHGTKAYFRSVNYGGCASFRGPLCCEGLLLWLCVLCTVPEWCYTNLCPAARSWRPWSLESDDTLG